MASVRDIAWMAGLLEGEGHFSMSQISVRIQMTDLDVIERFAGLMGITHISAYTPRHDGYKTQYSVVVCGKKAAGLMMTILPLMGARRSERIRRCLLDWLARPKPARERTHCKAGHELVVVSGQRGCRVCRNQQEREQRQMRRVAA